MIACGHVVGWRSSRRRFFQTVFLYRRGGVRAGSTRPSRGIVDRADAPELFDGTKRTSRLCDFVDRQMFPRAAELPGRRLDNHPARGAHERLHGSYTERSRGRRGQVAYLQLEDPTGHAVQIWLHELNT